jgi:PAS domain-containing protein
MSDVQCRDTDRREDTEFDIAVMRAFIEFRRMTGGPLPTGLWNKVETGQDQVGRQAGNTHPSQAFLDSADEAILLLSSTQNVVMINRRFADLLRTKREHLLGRRFDELMPHIQRAFSDAQTLQAHVTDTIANTRDLRMASVNQHLPAQHLLLFSSPILRPDHSSLGRLFILCDYVRVARAMSMHGETPADQPDENGQMHARAVETPPGSVKIVVEERPQQPPYGQATDDHDVITPILRGRSQKSTTWSLGGHARLALLVGLLALVVGLVDFGMIIGSMRALQPGPRAKSPAAVANAPNYGFNTNVRDWATRGAIKSAGFGGPVADGWSSQAFQAQQLSLANKAFIYSRLPRNIGPHSRFAARVYVPAGAPPLICTIYILGRSWRWFNGPLPLLSPSQWTNVTYLMPKSARLPVHEVGFMIIGIKGFRPYTGPLYLDSVGMPNR